MLCSTLSRNHSHLAFTKHEITLFTYPLIIRVLTDCGETLLTGESRFHISTPLGIEPGSLMMGSRRVDHWTSGTVYECSEIAGSSQASPQAADYVGCEAGGGPAASVKPGQKSCVRSSGIITLLIRRPSDGSG
jgi:hypothetical protein